LALGQLGCLMGCLVATDVPPPKAVVTKQGSSATIPCPIFPSNNVWNTPVDQLLVDEHTAAYLGNMDPEGHLAAGFNSGRNGTESGIPYLIVGEDAKKVDVLLQEADESDHGPFPIPNKPPLEQASGGRLILLDVQTCFIYELQGLRRDPEQQWIAASAAVFDLRSHILRRQFWGSADAAGMAIFPGLVRYEEVAAGTINHALRFSTPRTRKTFVWPARHADSNIFDAGYPPMGTRFRLKANFRLNDFSPQTRIILRALQTYGMFVADNGSPWTLSGAPDKRWNDVQLEELNKVPASAFEAVDESPLMEDVNLGIARQDVRPEEGHRQEAPKPTEMPTVVVPSPPKPEEAKPPEGKPKDNK
jgi:hypothetical protein